MRLLKKSAAFLIVVAIAAAGGASTVSASTTIDQLGSDIDGEAANDHSGSSVSLSSDGSIIAISAQDDDNGTDSGHVRLYEWNGTAWQQKGNDIDGEAAEDRSGYAVSLSSNGSIVAISAVFNDGTNGGDSGHVRVYEWNGSAWQQKGNDIDGEAADDYSGRSVSLSSDGAIVAIGAYGNDGNGDGSGHVRLYEWNGTAWQQKGNDIDGEAAGDYSGWSVSLSSDGSIVAIGAPGNDDNGTDSGHVRLYEWNGTAWQQKGNDIDGEAAEDRSGYAVSLSSNGSIVAISAVFNDGTNGGDSGHVRVYEWNGSAWQQKGNDIDGEAADDYSGRSVSLSSDGAIVAIGAYGNDGNGDGSGHVRLYEWNGTAWQQKGNDLEGEAENDVSGSSVSLSSDGAIVAIGAFDNDGNGANAGHVRLFEWDGEAWVQKGSDIDGEAADDYSGSSVSLSSDGSIVAIGALGNDGDGASSQGHVRVYEWDGSAWQQKGNDIDGEAASDYSGSSVSLSSDGAIVAIGAVYNDGINGEDSGHVRVYSIATTQNITTPEPDENVELPATGSMGGIVSQVLLVLGAGGLLMLFSRRRLSVRD